MLKGKEKQPLKAKDVVKLEELQSRHPGTLSEAEQAELDKLTERRNTYGEV